MAKKKAAEAEPTKPTFDPADFFADDDDDDNDGLLENQDFGNELDEIDRGTEDGEPEAETEDEPEAEPEAEESDEEPVEDEEPEAEDEPETEDEPEAETEDEPEAEDEDEPEDKKPRGKPNHMIPKRRLDSQIAKTRQLEKQLQDMQRENAEARREAAEKAKVPDEQIQEWLTTSAQKALDGETTEAAALQRKAFDAINSNKGEPAQTEQPLNPDDLANHIEERVELKSTVKQMLTEYPQLNPDHDTFDENLNEEVLDYQDFYLSKGYTPSAAVEKAVQMLSAAHDLKPAGYEEPKPKKTARSTKPDVKKKIDAASRQPADPVSRRGNKVSSEESVNINDLDDEAYNALPESVKARARGDI